MIQFFQKIIDFNDSIKHMIWKLDAIERELKFLYAFIDHKNQRKEFFEYVKNHHEPL